jgi:hypothetical protein
MRPETRHRKCYGIPKKELTGARFGRLVVIKQAGFTSAQKEKRTRTHILWFCTCDCGNSKVVTGGHLRAGTRSCGCLQEETRGKAQITHGASRSAEYNAWCGIKARCENDPDYAGRGITISAEWVHSFENFLAHIGPRPTPDHSVDRIDNDGNYEPGNVRWATREEQANNTRRKRIEQFSDEALVQETKRRGLEIT